MANIRTFTEAGIPEHQSVAEKTYDTPEVLDPKHIRWKHLNNPFGPSDAIEIRNDSDDMELIGRAFLVRRNFVRGDGTTLAGATVTDLVVRPEHRSAMRLVDLVKSVKAFSNSKFVIHSSNEISDVFYRNMFKFPVHFSLSSAGCPMRVLRLLLNRNVPKVLSVLADGLFSPVRWASKTLKAIMNAVTGLHLGEMPSGNELAAIHAAHHARTGPQFQRDELFVDWRYRTGPVSKSNLYGLYHRSRGCIGYIAVRQATVDGLSFIILMDLVTNECLTGAALVWLKATLLQLTIQADADVAFVMYNGNHPEQSELGNFPFMRIPDSVLPHPTPIFSHRHESVDAIEGIEKIYFTLTDLDYF